MLKPDSSPKEAMIAEHVPSLPKISGAQIEPTQLEYEKRVSFNLKKETIVTRDLDDPSAHAFHARIVARVRKRSHPSTQNGALNRKRLKTFATDNKGKVVATGFHTETKDEHNSSSNQAIYGANESCIIDTGSEVNLLGRKHLSVFEKACISYKTNNAATPLK